MFTISGTRVFARVCEASALHVILWADSYPYPWIVLLNGGGSSMDYLIIGAGPAGLQLGYLLGQAGRDYQIFEAGAAPGGFFETYPRHRQLISINKVHTGWSDPELNLRTDWNSLLCDDERLRFTRYSERYFPTAEDLVRYLRDFADEHRLRIRYQTRVTRIAKNSLFQVTDES